MTMLALALSACTAEVVGDVPADCPGDGAPTDVSATLTDMATVVRVTWEADVPARVVYTADGVTTTTPEAEGATLLLGLTPQQDVRLHVEIGEGDARACSDVTTVRTGALPGVPGTTVSVDEPRDVEGWHTVAVLQERRRFATILNARGAFVWSREVPNLMRATLSRERDAVLANVPAAVWDGVGELIRFPLDGGEPTIVEVPRSHTDFIELPDGTIAVLGWERRGFRDDSRWLLGDTILEVDPDGTVREVWNVFDHFDPHLDSGPYAPSPAGGGDTTLEEWSHINSISYDASSDDYLVTSSFNHAVIRVDRGSGEVVWVLTHDGQSDFPIAGDEDQLRLPHSAQLLDGESVLTFNRGPLGSTDDPAPCAWVSEMTITDGVATPTWRYTSDDCLTVAFLGQTRRIDGGHTVVNWSAAGRLSQVDASHALALQVDLAFGSAFGFGEWSESLYAP